MKRTKKIITATLVSAFALSSLAACSSDDSNKEETTKATTQATTVATTTTKETTETTISPCVAEYYYGVDVTIKAELASEDVTPDYVDSDSENSKVILFTPDDSLSEIVYTGISSEPYEDWYTITSCPEELEVFDSADADHPIAIQMDPVDGNPTRAFQFADSEGSYHLALIHYDAEADEFQIDEIQAAG